MTHPRRVLELSSSIAGAYASRLLGDLGWDVVMVEPSEGDPRRRTPSRWGTAHGAAFAAMSAGKRSVVASAEDIERLAAQADVVVGDFRARPLGQIGLGVDAFERLAPGHAVVSVTPFGLTGPKRGWEASDLTVEAASGLMFLTGEADQPPQQLAPYQAELTGGVMAASAALAALRLGEEHEVARIDVSLQEAMATHTFQAVGPYVYYGEVARREQRIKAGLRMVPTSDGYVYCAPGAVNSMRMDGIAQLLDEPRLAEERFQTAEGRMTHWDEFIELFVPPFRQKTAQEWFEAAEALHMTFALVQTIEDLFGCPQLGSRDFLRDVTTEDGRTLTVPLLPYITSSPEVRNASSPVPSVPAVGEHTAEVLGEWLSGATAR
ncbi:MAG: CoA transferase [Dehalococcoidia bacterium]|nr:CoA transferase [Dehalococcoidia bacterium]